VFTRVSRIGGAGRHRLKMKGSRVAEQERTTPRSDSVVPLAGELIERVGWFIHLRWIAVAGVAAGAVAGWTLGYPIPHGALGLMAFVIAAYNTALGMEWKKMLRASAPPPRLFQVFCLAQIVLDYLALAVIIHLTGGIESPVTVFFVFHIIVASILLPGRSVYLDALLASALVGVIALGEATRLLAHFSVLIADERCYFQSLKAAGAIYFFLVLTFFVSSFLGSTIGRSLGDKLVALFNLKTSLEAANAQLRALDKEKTDFMHLVTHELRSPLTGMRSILQTFLSMYMGPLSEEQRALLTRADARAEAMIALVNDLLRLAHARAETPPEKVGFDLGEEVHSVCEFSRPQAEEAKIVLAVVVPSEPLLIVADRDDIHFVVTNLLSNALKYTPEGGRVEVALARTDAYATIAVRDTGIGIPAGELAKIFTEFFRGSNAKKRKTAGTGLGLAILKRLVDAHGGTVEVASVEGEGSTFTVRLPRGLAGSG
jgi:signal transduction histidine kinase